MDKAQLKEILYQHRLWLDGNGGERANLFGVDLSEANLFGVDLSEADLSGANLSEANLSGADLFGADLSRADLRRANLRGADPRWANLSGADLSGANLFGADLSGAYLRRADLGGAYLNGANVGHARGILQWQSPCGEKRICYSVKHTDCVMHKLGCFWGTTEEAVAAIRKKYGKGSLYEEFLLMQVKALEQE